MKKVPANDSRHALLLTWYRFSEITVGTAFVASESNRTLGVRQDILFLGTGNLLWWDNINLCAKLRYAQFSLAHAGKD